MITTFDVARWAVRAVLVGLLLNGVFLLVRDVVEMFWIGAFASPGGIFVSILIQTVPLWVYGALFFFSDVIVREMVGETEKLEHRHQFRLLGVSLVGFIMLALALSRAVAAFSLFLLWLSQNGFEFSAAAFQSNIAIGQRSPFLRETIYAAIQLSFGLILFFWRRIARLLARSSV